MSDTAKRAGVFLGVFVLAVIVGALALGGGGQSAPAVDEVNASAFNTGDAVASVPEETGEVSMSEDGSGNTVVVDTTRSQRITPESLAPMANALTESGATVRFTGRASSAARYGTGGLNESLQSADAYVVFGAKQPYTDAELAGLKAFTDAGGRVLVLNEPQRQAPSILSLLGGSSMSAGAPSPLVPLTSEYGVTYDNGYLYNMADNANNYRNVYATPAGDSALTEGVERTVFHESVSVTGGESVLTATEGTELSATRRADTYPVLTRSDNLVAVGDTSVMSQEYVYRADNEVLVGNLLDFLVSGEKSPEDAPSSGSGGGFGGGGVGGSSGGGSAEPTRTPTLP